MIIVFTNKQDVHADEVIRRFNHRKIPVFRINSEDIISKYKIEIHIVSNKLSGKIENEVGRFVNIEDIKVAWFRKPEFQFSGMTEIDIEARGLVLSETKALIDILYSIPSITWINDPFFSAKSKVKAQQLILAHSYGVNIPDTLVTTDPEAAKEFFIKNNEEVLVKSIYSGNTVVNGLNQGIPSRKIGSDIFYRHYKNVSFCPTQFQNYIEKDYEIRVTVIGDKIFAVKIESQLNLKTKIDWRVHTRLNRHSVLKLPKEIEEFCLRFLGSQNLLFGAMDFIVTPNSEYFFLENNPFGQYLWMEIETGIPLTDAICDLLIHWDA